MFVPIDTCFTIGLFLEFLFGIIYHPRAGIIVSVMIAIAKEIEDQNKYGCFDWTKTVALMSGTAAGYIILGIAHFN